MIKKISGFVWQKGEQSTTFDSGWGETGFSPICILGVIVAPSLEQMVYQQMVTWSFAMSAHPLMYFIKASGMCPCSLSALLIVLATELGSKACIIWGFHVWRSTSFIHTLQGFPLTFSDCVSEYMVSTALRIVKFSIYPQARKRHRSLQCKITSGFDSDLEEL